MNRDLQRKKESDVDWLDTVKAWAVSLRDIPQEEFGEVYLTALGAHEGNFPLTVIEMRDAWRRICKERDEDLARIEASAHVDPVSRFRSAPYIDKIAHVSKYAAKLRRENPGMYVEPSTAMPALGEVFPREYTAAEIRANCRRVDMAKAARGELPRKHSLTLEEIEEAKAHPERYR